MKHNSTNVKSITVEFFFTSIIVMISFNLYMHTFLMITTII